MFPLLAALVAVLIQQKAPYEMTVTPNRCKCSDNLLENIQLEYINILDFHHQFTVSDLKPLLSCWLGWVCLGGSIYPSGLHHGWQQRKSSQHSSRLEARCGQDAGHTVCAALSGSLTQGEESSGSPQGVIMTKIQVTSDMSGSPGTVGVLRPLPSLSRSLRSQALGGLEGELVI